jgi:multiple sugar transport system permease protein
MASDQPPHRHNRLQLIGTEAGAIALGAVLVVWSLTPVYNMLLIALDPDEGEIEFAGNIWPPEPSLEGFRLAVTQQARYLGSFWRQMGNSLYIGLLTMFLTVLIASLASFSVGRMQLSKGSLLTNTALLVYVIPASFLVVPYYRIMHSYGLLERPWAVIVAQVAFAAPFAIMVLLQYAKLIPLELDEAARVDGASVVQVYLRIYLPLMMPALAVAAVYSLLLSWNDYVYQFALLSSRNMTASIMQAHLFTDADAHWNAMMAAAIIYALPPFVLFFVLRRHMTTGLTMWGIAG